MIGRRIPKNTIKTKSGLASFYIVTFVTLILSIIVLSFVHIVINSSNRTGNDDLYQSAYDSALAGVEDARIALIKYQECLGKNTPECIRLRGYIENGSGDCDAIAHALGRIDASESKEVPIVEKKNSSSTSGSESMDQAYTCVSIDLSVPDYRSTLSSSNRVAFVPIRVNHPDGANAVKKVRLAWFSDAVKEQGHKYTYPATYGTDNNGGDHTYFYPASDSQYTYLPITVDLYQTNDVYTIGELTTNNGGGTDHSSFVLQPSAKGDHYMSAGDVLNQNDKFNNFPEQVKCDDGGEFNCYTDIELPAPYRGGRRNNDTFFIRVESPYGQSALDFAVALYDGGGNQLDFSGVQAHVDSTGRANDLVRRVETRIDFLTDFPYPEFAIQLNPEGSDATMSKNFSVANNCWYSNTNGAADCSQDNGRGADGFDAF